MIKKTAMMAAATALFLAYGSDAAPTLGPQTWDGGVNGWVETNLYGSMAVSHNAIGGNLELSVTGVSQPGFGLVAGAGDPYLVGDFTALGAVNSDLRVEFDFITTGSTPGALGLYFMGSSGRLWGYDLLSQIVPPSGGSTEYSVSIGTFGGWEGQNGTYISSQFYADLANVAWLGLFIQGAAAGTEVYGLDNMSVTLLVPEPETVWMILAIVLSLAITFRSRLVDTVGQLKARYIKA